MFSLESPLLVKGNGLYLPEMKHRSVNCNHREWIGFENGSSEKISSSRVPLYYRNLTVQEV